MTEMYERRRPREEPHLRSIAEQTLDVLLRIEELLIAQARPVITGPDKELARAKADAAQAAQDALKAAQGKPKGRK